MNMCAYTSVLIQSVMVAN